MRCFLIILVLLVLKYEAEALTDREQFNNFKKTFKKNYKSRSSDTERFQIFQKNLRTIEKHNAKADRGESTYWLGINQFADMTHQEFTNIYTKPIPYQTKISNEIILSAASPTAEIDWRARGAVTPVKDQGDCASCWAFTVTASIESAIHIKTNKSMSLSEQNLLDCDVNSSGCRGGSMTSAFKWIMKNKGLQLGNDYPYEAQEGVCRFNRKKTLASIFSYRTIKYKNEAAIENAVLKQPVSVALCAGESFRLYKFGIYRDSKCCKTLNCANHAVTLVGLGYSNDSTAIPFYHAKNSWGSAWGEDGYIRIERGVDQCGLSNMASYPIIK